MARPVRVVGVPTDYGANRRGVDMGPSAIRYAGIAEAVESTGRSCSDDGDVSLPRRADSRQEADAGRPDARHLDAVEEIASRLADRVAETLPTELPLVLGGDHSLSIGSVVGSARDADLGVVWVDAHGDLNTPETTPSGNVHGMPLAAALGLGAFADAEWARAGVNPTNVALVGVRDLDPGERARIDDLPLSVHTISEIDERGIAPVVDDALDVATDGTDGVHLSLDLDVVDPSQAPGVGTPVRGGITYREAHTAVERVADRDVLRSMDLVEVNPILDDHNETAELAVELAASALGKRIL